MIPRLALCVVLGACLTGALAYAQSGGPATVTAIDPLTGAAVNSVGDATNNALRVGDINSLAVLRALTQMNATLNSLHLRGTFNQAITSTAGALDVNIKSPAPDPCASLKLNAAISQTANARIVAGASGKRIYVCAEFLAGADAENLSFVEGTGTTCGTATAAVVGGATAAAGPNMAANGGWTKGAGIGTVSMTAVQGDDLCLFQSGAGRVAGNITYVLY